MRAYRMVVGVLTMTMLAITGCATITRGTTEALVINSNPPGAQVQMSSGNTCVTPCSVELKRKHDYHVKIAKAGYEPVEANVSSQIVTAGAVGMAGNVLIGGLIGVGVDAMTGATKGLRPNPLEVTLVPLNGVTAAAPPLATTVLRTAAATSSSLATVAVEKMCNQPSTVDQAECRGVLKLGMSRDEVLGVIGVPTAKSADEMTLRYGDHYVEFDDANRLTKISDMQVP